MATVNKPCPFCGADPQEWPSDIKNGIHIQCRNRKCPVKPHVEGYTPRARKAWNTRTEDGGEMHRITRKLLTELAGANDCKVSDITKDHAEALNRAVTMALYRKPGWKPTDEEIQLMTDGEVSEMDAFFKTLPNGEELDHALSDCFSDLA